MKRVLITLLLFLSLSMPVLAQEETVQPTDVPVITVVEPSQDEPIEVPQDTSVVLVDEAENPALLVALAIAGVVIVVFSGALVALISQLAKSIPPEVMAELQYNRPRIEARLDEAFDRLDELADATANPLDDFLSNMSREQVQRYLDAFYGAEQPPAPTVPPA